MTGHSRQLARSLLKALFLSCLTCFSVITSASDTQTRRSDPHYSPNGFFDIHICNWPDRPPFFLSLFSTYQFDKVKKIEVFNPDGSFLDTIGKQRFKLIEKKGKPVKRVFIKHTELPNNAQPGWYTTTVTMNDGNKLELKDYVIIDHIDWARETKPAANASNIRVPTQLSWKAIPGAGYYKVFIKDLWEDGKVILKSKLLKEPRLNLKPGLLQTDGWYEWRVHARDSNGHVLLGDFNHGSLSPVMKFTTRSE